MTLSHQDHAEYLHSYFTRFMSLERGSTPGFSHSLKVAYHDIDFDRLSFGEDSLTYRYPLSKHVPKFTAGLLLALMDELTTEACFSVGRPAAPGFSLQMQVDLLQTNLDQYDELDIVNTITKLGKTISHCRTEFVCHSTKALVAFCSHVKYMPTGDKGLDKIIVDDKKWKQFMDSYYGNMVPPLYKSKALFDEVLLPSFDFQSPSQSTFRVTGDHTNPFGTLHGGCHAMVIEQAALHFARSEMKRSDVVVVSEQINYVAGASGTLNIRCEVLGGTEALTGLHVRVLLRAGDELCSEGKLRILPATQLVKNSKL